ncbi:MAG: hypothetical protein F2545_07325 [Actinobacteria bacterium]|uniref:Unannotated protein n=1 Tax=freshwater metagenome TaxID=449393 RepID=A0A6J6E852_9ZZZZ|nr:hypothetical protein [Actinomycetota bacterium]
MSVSATSDQIARNEKCLQILIPALQQAMKDFLNSPESAIARIVDAARQFNSMWSYSPDQARAALDIILNDGLIGSETSGAVGSFDPQRTSEFLQTFRQSFPDVTDSALTADQLVTNEFLDASISLQP